MMNLIRSLFNFKSRSNRQDYWFTLFGLLAVDFIFIPVFGVISYFSLAIDIKIISALLLLFLLALSILLAVALIALVVRRVRDAKIMKIAFIGSILFSPIISISILSALPKTFLEFLRVQGKEHLVLASSLLVLFAFGFPFLAIGLFPSKD